LCDTVQLPVLDIDAQLPQQHWPVDTVEQAPELPLIIATLLSIYGNSTWQIGNLPQNSKVSLFNALGQLVYRSENYAHELTARQLAAGMYFYEITPPAADMQKGKLVVIR
jgi:hypothetical protein